MKRLLLPLAIGFLSLPVQARADDGNGAREFSIYSHERTTTLHMPLDITPEGYRRSMKGMQYSRDKEVIVCKAAVRNGVPPALLVSQAHNESAWNCNAVSSAGAVGILQVKPATARSVGVYGNLKDCAVGAEAGARYMRQALVASKGDQRRAVALYHAGLYARHIGRRSNMYANSVMAMMRRFT